MDQLKLQGKNIDVTINDDMSLSVSTRGERTAWESSKSRKPTAVVRHGSRTSTISPAAASQVSVSEAEDGKYRGKTVRLSGYGDIDVVLEFSFMIDADADELLVQAAQSGGRDSVVSVEHFYRFEKPVADGGYMVLPHGSGYLIAADCSDELPGEAFRGGLIGARWALPMFGIVRGDLGMCAIVETWWDCDVEPEHQPGRQSALDFHWRPSLGTLRYPRRFVLSFAKGMDYVAMAKLYRRRAAEEGLVRTLQEKAVETPAISRYIANVLLRWPAWNTQDGPAVLKDIRVLRDMGFGINFFFPKWPSLGYSPDRSTGNTSDAGWQAYLHPDPVPGGWQSLAGYAEAVRELGCIVQAFVCPRTQHLGGPGYDEERWPLDEHGIRPGGGENQPGQSLSTHDAVERTKWVLDGIESNRLGFDVLYFDGYSAYSPVPEDFSPSHPVSFRQTYEAQNDCLAETRRRGIMPGAEVARFWCIADCDYFFFSDWSSDRLSNAPVQGAPAPVGEPVPLFQLVFHDCCIAGFSGGGYGLYAPGYDWWSDRTPRLYELLFASAPAHNWLPDGYVPVRDWEDEKTKRRWAWLKRWSNYYRSIATSEMISHRFLSSDWKQHRVEFANGVAAEFDTAANRMRIKGIPGFSGDWEEPEAL